MTAQTKENNNRKTTLYKFWNDEGRLLYVGISANGPGRWKAHNKEKIWWDQVKFSQMLHFDTRAEAEQAEAEAIRIERPIYNVIHNGEAARALKPRKPKPKKYRFFGRMSLESYLRNSDCQLNDGFYDIPLWLYYELDGSTYVEDRIHDVPDEFLGRAQFILYVDYVQRNHPEWWEKDQIPIYWAIEGGRYIFERAPYKKNDFDFEDIPEQVNSWFLKWFTWPVDEDGKPINWFQMEMKSQRLPHLREFLLELGWSPNALQPSCPLRSLYQLWKSTAFYSQDTNLFLEEMEKQRKAVIDEQ